MPMNVQLLRETFERAKKENGGATALGMSFYARLFEKYPQVRPLFKTPPEEQHKKLIASLASIVGAVEKPDVLLPFLHAMGIRHLKYKTENSHYAAVSENLVAVLSEHLSKEGEFTDEMRSTWEAALKTVSDIMIEAADNPEKFEADLAAAGFEPNGFKKNDPRPWVLEEELVAR